MSEILNKFPLQSSAATTAVVCGAGCAILSGLFIVWIKSAKSGDITLIKSDREILHEKFADVKVPEEVDVILIGSGMGSLSCAAILARLGRKVLVLEQHDDVCGGGTHTFIEKGYKFDSGLHYTVPWSVPIFALTCLKKQRDVIPFHLMGEEDGTVDKIYLVDPDALKADDKIVDPFTMKFKEAHIKTLYDQFPDEKHAIDEYIRISNNAMTYVKVYLLSRLLPRWLQNIYWTLIPSHIIAPAQETAKDLLPRLTSNKKLISLLSSMWIDTGARPDKATFMLTASVFRGETLNMLIDKYISI